MLAYKTFNVEIERKVEVRHLYWPKPREADDEISLGSNHHYSDLRGLPLSEAERVYDLETSIIVRLEESNDPEETFEQIEDELYEEFDDHLYGLDLGVASSATALSATGSIPFTSCNAGAFGGLHHEYHPSVAFYSKPKSVALLIECAEEAKAGLSNADYGTVLLYSDDIRKMRAFAKALISRGEALVDAQPELRLWEG